MKNWKTTALGIVGLVVIALTTFNVYTAEQSAELGDYLEILIGAIASLIGFFAKDADSE